MGTEAIGGVQRVTVTAVGRRNRTATFMVAQADDGDSATLIISAETIDPAQVLLALLDCAGRMAEALGEGEVQQAVRRTRTLYLDGTAFPF